MYLKNIFVKKILFKVVNKAVSLKKMWQICSTFNLRVTEIHTTPKWNMFCIVGIHEKCETKLFANEVFSFFMPIEKTYTYPLKGFSFIYNFCDFFSLKSDFSVEISLSTILLFFFNIHLEFVKVNWNKKYLFIRKHAVCIFICTFTMGFLWVEMKKKKCNTGNFDTYAEMVVYVYYSQKKIR